MENLAFLDDDFVNIAMELNQELPPEQRLGRIQILSVRLIAYLQEKLGDFVGSREAMDLADNIIQNLSNRLPNNILSVLKFISYGVVLGLAGNELNKYVSKRIDVKVQDETHIPLSSNFNGRGTKVGNRVGIKFKKDKVGTYPFQVPVDLSDFFAMVHDFSYMSNSNIDRSFADIRYFLSAYYREDFLKQLVKYDIVKEEDIPIITEEYNDKFSGISLGLASILRLSGITEINYTDPDKLSKKILNTLLSNFVRGFGVSLREGIQRRVGLQPISPFDVFMGFIPNWKKIGLMTAEQISKIPKKLFSKDEFSKNHNKAVESMYKYLGSVGQFNQKGIFILKDKDSIVKDDILNIYNDFLKDYNDMVSEGDYPTEKAELINKEDTEKYEAVTSAGTTVDRDELEPSGLSLDVVKGWFDFTEEEVEEPDIEFEVEEPDIDFEVEKPEDPDIDFEVEEPDIDFEVEAPEEDIEFELEANEEDDFIIPQIDFVTEEETNDI
jgi:hypothetical protein